MYISYPTDFPYRKILTDDSVSSELL